MGWRTHAEGGNDSEGKRRKRRGKLRHSLQTLQAAPCLLSKSGRRVLFLAPRKPSEAARYFPSTSRRCLVNINKPGRVTFWSVDGGAGLARDGFPLLEPPPPNSSPTVHAHIHLLDNRRNQNQYCICHPSVSFLLPQQPGCH